MADTVRKFPDQSILLHPQIPKPLHLMNPRTIMGQSWWDEQRKEAYRKHDMHCHACGILKYDAWYRQWLEGHEMYDINYETGEVRFVEVVALCYCCHNFIHAGRLARLVETNEISMSHYQHVIDYGTKVLATARLSKSNNEITQRLEELRRSGKVCSWEDYHLTINGVNYGQRFHSYEEWAAYWGYDLGGASLDDMQE